MLYWLVSCDEINAILTALRGFCSANLELRKVELVQEAVVSNCHNQLVRTLPEQVCICQC